MDIQELDGWKAFDRISPIDHAMRAELSAGIIAGNVLTAQTSQNYPASDFMVDWESSVTRPPPGEPVPDLNHKLDAVFGAFTPPPPPAPRPEELHE